MNHAGIAIDEVLRSAFGGTTRGAEWQHKVYRVLEHGCVSTGWMHDAPVRHGEAVKRKLVEDILRKLNAFKRHHGRLLAPRLFLGRSRRVFWADPQTGEVLRRHCPAAQAHGHAARMRRGPRQCGRYSRLWHNGDVLGRCQPPSWAPDAIVARRGDWAYQQHFLLPGTQLPEAALARLRESWDESATDKRDPDRDAFKAAPPQAPLLNASRADLHASQAPPDTTPWALPPHEVEGILQRLKAKVRTT